MCQLECPCCPIHRPGAQHAVGLGFLKLHDFQNLLLANPHIREIELCNYGEMFLNPDLLDILRCAHERGVALHASSGVNLNLVSDVVLEGLVKYGLQDMTCSIDGASGETYALYRVNGEFSTVMENLGKLNANKAKYGSDLPRLTWQFVVFGHNEHEIARARELARSLGMSFALKLSWDPSFSPISNEEAVRREVGAASREEYRRLFGHDYLRRCCYDLWNDPQINWDGRVLGCSRNFWDDFGGNAFSDGLTTSLRSQRLRSAKRMLMGKARVVDDVPCSTCSVYLDMCTNGTWLTKSEIRKQGKRMNTSWRPPARIRQSAPYRVAKTVYRTFRPAPRRKPAPPLPSAVYPLAIPLAPDLESGFKPYGLFDGRTRGLRHIDCHVSALTTGSCPHPPHAHDEEEILMLLDGQVDLVVALGGDTEDIQREPLRPGQFVYYPRQFPHTIETTSDRPANYLMFRWSDVERKNAGALRHALHSPFQLTAGAGSPGFSTRLVIEGPTSYLKKLQCHESVLAPGAGYDPHIDAYDVGIVVVEGEVETLGRRVGPHAAIFYAAGEPHGMRNPGCTAARYVVFEFHGRAPSVP